MITLEKEREKGFPDVGGHRGVVRPWHDDGLRLL
jgi:hypothetical protein